MVVEDVPYHCEGVVYIGADAKVCNLDTAVEVHQHICRLDIPVYLRAQFIQSDVLEANLGSPHSFQMFDTFIKSAVLREAPHRAHQLRIRLTHA